jgi:hypothetical protein
VELDVKILTTLVLALMVVGLLSTVGGLLFDVILTQPRMYP